MKRAVRDVNAEQQSRIATKGAAFVRWWGREGSGGAKGQQVPLVQWQKQHKYNTTIHMPASDNNNNNNRLSQKVTYNLQLALRKQRAGADDKTTNSQGKTVLLSLEVFKF